MSLALQYGVIVMLLGAALLQLARRIAPHRVWQWQARLAFALERQPQKRWRARLGHWLRPALPAANCGSGCARCNGCGSGG